MVLIGAGPKVTKKETSGGILTPGRRSNLYVFVGNGDNPHLWRERQDVQVSKEKDRPRVASPPHPNYFVILEDQNNGVAGGKLLGQGPETFKR